MIRGFKELLKANDIYFTIPLNKLQNKSIGIDGDYFIRKYVDTSFKFTFETIKLGQENIKKMVLYFKEHNINILWVWSNENSGCYKCTIPISENTDEATNKTIKLNSVEKEYRVRKRNSIDKILTKYDIKVIKAPSMACAQLVDATKRNVINYMFSDEEALLLDRCGYLITDLDPIFSDKTCVPVLIKSKILTQLGIGGKIFSYLCMTLGNLYCPTHPFFKYNFDPFKVYNFVVENMNTFSKLKVFTASLISEVSDYKGSYNLCNSEYHIWFMKFIYAENKFYRIFIFKEDTISYLSNVHDNKNTVLSSKDLLNNSNPFYNEVLYESIECILCRKELNTDLLKGIDSLIKKLTEFIPKKYLLKNNKTVLNRDKTEYLLFLIKIVLCTKTDELKLSPVYKLIVALIYTKDINTEDILFIKKHSLKYNSNINFTGKYFKYKKRYSNFLELLKYLKMFLDNTYFRSICKEDGCSGVFYYMPQFSLTLLDTSLYTSLYTSLDTSLDTSLATSLDTSLEIKENKSLEIKENKSLEIKEYKENINTQEDFLKEHIKTFENYYLCLPCISHEIHSYKVSIDYLMEYIEEGELNEKHTALYKGVLEYLEGFL